VCATCVVTAAAGVTGLRAWIQARAWNWLTPRRLRRMTIASAVAALAAATVTF
jgi:hypothetical protein